MLKSPPLVATLSDSMRMSPCSWGDIFTWPLRGDRIIGLRHSPAFTLPKFRSSGDNFVFVTQREGDPRVMANISTKRGVIGILTGGGDVPGLNPAIRGGTLLHSSRTNPGRVAKSSVPAHLKDKFTAEKNDLTAEVLKNLAWLGIDTLIPIGGDDTLSYGVRLHKEGFKVIGIPKTMDNDVPGTDYCIGFSTCVTRTIQMVNSLRTSAGSHERFMVLEVFGRYAGFTAMLPTMAGAANRCVIPEYKFNIEHLTELLVDDRRKNPSRYSIVLVSEGAMFEGGEMVFEGEATDAYGHKKLGG